MFLLLFSIVYSSAFECGITPYDNMNVYVAEFWQEVTGNKISFYFDLETQLKYKGFFIGGGIKTFAGKPITKIKEFHPYKTTYKFLVGYEYKNFQIGFRHYCIHPVVPYVTFDSPIIFQGAYEELYIRWETEK